MARTITAIAGVVAILIIAGAGALLVWPGPDEDASPYTVDVRGSDLGGAFELTRHDGERVGLAEIADRPVLLYFGYTYCPDVCPLDTQTMVEAVGMLGERGIAARPVFVTVDPARDTAEALAEYAGYMHPEMVGLTGSDEEIAAVAGAYKVYYAKVEMEDSAAGYLMNHSSFTYLLAPGGEVLALFRHGTPPETMAAETARILGASS